MLTRNYKKIGSFNLSQPNMTISDPCYKKNEWCSCEVKKCCTGAWNASISKKNFPWNDNDGNKRDDYRITALFAKHQSSDYAASFGNIQWINNFIQYGRRWKLLSDNIGVDSGQAGFFDSDMYGKNDLFDKLGNCGFGDKWYSNCCDKTINGGAGIIASIGVNAASGFGDGCYSLWGHENKLGNIDALALFFLPDEESEEDEQTGETI